MITLAICADCYAVALGDVSELDQYYTEAEAARIAKECDAAVSAELAAAGPNAYIVYAGEPIEFSADTCESCRSHLAGRRYRVNILGED